MSDKNPKSLLKYFIVDVFLRRLLFRLVILRTIIAIGLFFAAATGLIWLSGDYNIIIRILGLVFLSVIPVLGLVFSYLALTNKLRFLSQFWKDMLLYSVYYRGGGSDLYRLFVGSLTLILTALFLWTIYFPILYYSFILKPIGS